jgi:hypothetical protein
MEVRCSPGKERNAIALPGRLPVHAVRGNGTELATYAVEKGKPFLVVVVD